jgi:hypothetical protein
VPNWLWVSGTFRRAERSDSLIVALRDRCADVLRTSKYRVDDRCILFNEFGTFRHYP